VVEIPLGHGRLAFARVLREPLFEFFDLFETERPPVKEIVACPVLFSVWVMNSAITSGRWPILGNVSVLNDYKLPEFFKIDPITKAVTIYKDGIERPAEDLEWQRLERAAVWEPEHVEDRLRDHLEGRPNVWVESLKGDP
jgi:hypothetical protein